MLPTTRDATEAVGAVRYGLDVCILGEYADPGRVTLTPRRAAADLADLASRVGDPSFDLAIIGVTDGPDSAVAQGFADVGFTWWLEHIHGHRDSYGQLLARVEAGPPVAATGRPR